MEAVNEVMPTPVLPSSPLGIIIERKGREYGFGSQWSETLQEGREHVCPEWPSPHTMLGSTEGLTSSLWCSLMLRAAVGLRGMAHLLTDSTELLSCSWLCLLSHHQQCRQLPPRLLHQYHPWCQQCGGKLWQHLERADQDQRGTRDRTQGLSRQEHPSQCLSQERHSMSHTAPCFSTSEKRCPCPCPA